MSLVSNVSPGPSWSQGKKGKYSNIRQMRIFCLIRRKMDPAETATSRGQSNLTEMAKPFFILHFGPIFVVRWECGLGAGIPGILASFPLTGGEGAG